MCALINDVAPVTKGEHPMDELSYSIVFGANYLAFSQFGYIFYVLSMPIESTKIRASEWEQACLHTQRAQPNFVKQRTLRIWSLS